VAASSPKEEGIALGGDFKKNIFHEVLTNNTSVYFLLRNYAASGGE
jgi:hypothetical protein